MPGITTKGTMKTNTCPCGQARAPRRRKYCSPCATLVPRLARIRWKREARARNRGAAAHLDPWRARTATEAAARAAYNAYMRVYMRSYRSRKEPQHAHL